MTKSLGPYAMIMLYNHCFSWFTYIMIIFFYIFDFYSLDLSSVNIFLSYIYIFFSFTSVTLAFLP